VRESSKSPHVTSTCRAPLLDMSAAEPRGELDCQKDAAGRDEEDVRSDPVVEGAPRELGLSTFEQL
jgi:hypothetical protein